MRKPWVGWQGHENLSVTAWHWVGQLGWNGLRQNGLMRNGLRQGASDTIAMVLGPTALSVMSSGRIVLYGRSLGVMALGTMVSDRAA